MKIREIPLSSGSSISYKFEENVLTILEVLIFFNFKLVYSILGKNSFHTRANTKSSISKFKYLLFNYAFYL